MVDAYFHGLAQRRKAAQFRAEFSGAKVIWIDKQIGTGPDEISAAWLRSQLPTVISPVVLKIHSEGGSVIESLAMLDVLAAFAGRKTAVVESAAFSAASLLLCACDDTEISPNAYVMLHSPFFDRADVSQSERDFLDNLKNRMVEIYAAKTRQPASKIRQMMTDETFFDAKQSVDLGIVNRITKRSSTAVARTPAVLAKRKRKSSQTATSRWAQAVLAAGSVTIANKKHPGLRLRMLGEVNSGR